MMHSQLRDQLIRQHADLARQCLADGRYVLVAGVRPGNLPPALEQHRHVLCWTGNDAERRALPRTVGLILTTRFLGHGSLDRLTQLAAKTGAVVFKGQLSTGELRLLMQPLLEAPAAPPPALDEDDAATDDPPAPARRTFGHGELKAFVEANLPPGTDVPVTDAARQLLDLATAAGFSTTLGSLVTSVRQARQREEAERLAAPPPTPPPAPATEPPRLSEDEREVLRLFDDAIASIQLARERFVGLYQDAKGGKLLKEQLKAMLNAVEGG